MKKLSLLIFSLFVSFTVSFAQDTIPKIRHIEIISDSLTSDSLAALNKEDIDIINNVFHERNQLDSLVAVQDSMLVKLESISLEKSLIINNKDFIIKNNEKIKQDMQKMIENSNTIIQQKELELKKEKRKKKFWQSTTGICVGAIIAIICL